MNEPIWILEDIAQAVHSMLLAQHGGGSGIREEALLDSALARPKQKYTYEPGISIFVLAAAYSFGIAKNHCSERLRFLYIFSLEKCEVRI